MGDLHQFFAYSFCQFIVKNLKILDVFYSVTNNIKIFLYLWRSIVVTGTLAKFVLESLGTEVHKIRKNVYYFACNCGEFVPINIEKKF